MNSRCTRIQKRFFSPTIPTTSFFVGKKTSTHRQRSHVHGLHASVGARRGNGSGSRLSGRCRRGDGGGGDVGSLVGGDAGGPAALDK